MEKLTGPAAEGNTLLVNMDSQAPNQVLYEALAGGFCLPGQPGPLSLLRREVPFGDSRFDLYAESASEGGEPWRAFIEVKGVTLEEQGVCLFPDAPTERGVKHIRELMRAVEEGLDATLFFVIQMENICAMSPNDRTHPAFGAVLREAAQAGVGICARMCAVEPDTLVMAGPVPVIL